MTTPTSEYIWRIFEPGTPIVVDQGPLAGIQGTVLGVDEEQRLIVTIALLRGVIPVALDPEAVRFDDTMRVVRYMTH